MERKSSSENGARSIPNMENVNRRKSIFVSSTFRDMHVERDAIHNIVSPRVNEFARKHGGFVNFIDLRWGIDTSSKKEQEDKVLKVCLTEIDRCRPYFIGIIGDYYGSMPGPEKIKKVTKKHGIEGLCNHDISITDLEIDYGVLSGTKSFEASLFYFRNPLDYDSMTNEIRNKYNDNKSEKIKSLRKRIEENAYKHPKVKVSRYKATWDMEKQTISNVNDLADKMISDVIDRLSEEWNIGRSETTDLSWQEQSIVSDKHIIMSKNSCFIGRKDAIEYCVNSINSSNMRNPLIIKGESGTGKSSLLAHLTELLPRENIDVISLFCGNGPRTNSILDLIKNISYRLELLLEKQEHFSDESISDFESEPEIKTQNEWIQNVINLAYEHQKVRNRRIAILVDALDQLSPLEIENSLQHISKINAPGLSVVVTFIEGSRIKEPDNIIDGIILPPVSEKEIIETTKHIFEDNHKELPDIVYDAIIQKKSTSNHLYLNMIIQRLMMIDSEDLSNIDSENWSESHAKLMVKIVESLPKDIRGLSSHIVREALDRVSSKAVDKSVEYLAVTRRGLRETDLESVIKEGWNTVDFRILLLYLNSFFTERSDGRIDFSHKIIRDGILNEVENPTMIHANILKYLDTLDLHDTVRLSETIYHSCRKNDPEYLCCFLSSAYENSLTETIVPSVLEEISNESETIIEAASIAGEEFEKHFDCAYFFLYELRDLRNLNVKMLHQLFIIFNKLTTSLSKNTLDALVAKAISLGLKNIGDISLSLGKVSDAIDYYDGSLAFTRMVTSDTKTPETHQDLSANLKEIGNSIMSFTRNTSSAFQYYEESLAIAKNLVSEFKTLEARSELFDILICMGDALIKTDPKNALKYYEESLAVAKAILSEYELEGTPVLVSLSLNKVGDALVSLGKIPDAVNRYKESLSINRSLLSKLGPSARLHLSESLWRIGHVLTLSENIPDALKYYEESLDTIKSMASEIGTPVARRVISLRLKEMGEVLQKSGYYHNALLYYEESVTICRSIVSELDTPDSRHDLSISLSSAGDTLLELGDCENALKRYEESLAIAIHYASELGTSEARHGISFSLNRVGNALMLSDDLSGALRFHKEALDIVRSTASGLGELETQNDISYSLDRVGDVLMMSGDLLGALQHHEESIAIKRSLASKLKTPESLQELSDSLKKLNNIHNLSGNYQAADKCLKESTAIEKSIVGGWEFRRDLASGLEETSKILSSSRDVSGAIKQHNEALTIRESMFSDSDTPESLCETSDKLEEVGHTLLESEDIKGAIKYYKKSLEIRRLLALKLETYESLNEFSTRLHSVGYLHELIGDLCAIEYYEEFLGALKLVVSKFGKSALYRDSLFESLMETFNSLSTLSSVSGAIEYKKSFDNTLSLVDELTILISGNREVTNLDNNDSASDEKHDELIQPYKESLTNARLLSIELGTPESHRNLATALDEIGAILVNTDVPNASRYYEESLSIKRSLFSESKTSDTHHDLFYGLINMGFALESANDSLGAAKYYEEALAILKSNCSEFTDLESRQTISNCLERIGYDLGQSRYIPGTIKYYKEALVIKRAIASEFDTLDSLDDLSSCLGTLSLAFLKSNDLSQAMKYYDEYLAVEKLITLKDERAESQYCFSTSLEYVGDDFLSLGHVSHAIRYYEEAIQIHRSLASELRTPDSRENLKNTLESIIETLEDHGKKKEAKKYRKELKNL